MRTAPTSYAGELQELKGVVMRAQDNLAACFIVWPPFIEGLHIDKHRAAELLDMGHILATEIADNLTMQGVPFREAYAKVKDLVDRAEAEGCQVHKLPAEVLGSHFLSAEQATTKRAQAGGTASMRIREAITRIRHDLAIQ